EAYLGTLVFHCFYDRLRGKTAGVTAWTRFPLRLLTIQQTQRVADVIGMAELIRRELPDPRLSGADIDPFAVGYFVGEGGSPNEIYRYLTSMIVSTIDKLAALGNQHKMAQIFGQVDGRCSIHGYYKSKCCQKDCTDQKLLKRGRSRGLSGPTQFVQDELHLIK